MTMPKQYPVVIIPGVLFWDGLYDVMREALAEYLPVEKIAIAPVSFLDWTGFPPSPERSTNRVMAAIERSVCDMRRKFPGEPVTLVAHSGGGTVAMVYLLEQPFQGDVYHPGESVGKLLTLGTPFHTHEHYARIKTDFIFKHLDNGFFSVKRSFRLSVTSIGAIFTALLWKKCVICSIEADRRRYGFRRWYRACGKLLSGGRTERNHSGRRASSYNRIPDEIVWHKRRGLNKWVQWL